MPIVSFSVGEGLIKKFDEVIKGRGYLSRSEALREAMRDYVAQLSPVEGDNVFVISVIYGREIEKNLVSEVQHRYGDIIHTLIHLHLDDINCLEVLIVKGGKAKELIENIRGIRGVKEVKFIATACGV